jgi:hypothetical protein
MQERSLGSVVGEQEVGCGVLSVASRLVTREMPEVISDRFRVSTIDHRALAAR